jgi:valyl-tRNA synthetase
MSEPLAKSYSPVEHEDAIRARWDAARVFHADPANSPPIGDAAPFCILIPPPNVTAALHLGHAFNNTLQDILTRHHRMRGFNTLWMPGTDHASIGTQAVIERRLALQGKKRTDFTREQFIAIVQEWKDEYEATIIEQLKVMGCSCDFERTRFTMDEMCSKAVREAFFRLFKDGLIYRGKRLVNWDPVLQTAVADDEVYMEEVAGHMWYLRYPLEPTQAAAERTSGGAAAGRAATSPPDFITVATTRPETMLGDTAVAVNPKDPYASPFIGRQVRLPIVNRIVPIIGDDYVAIPVDRGGDENDPKAKIATGFLKVTPAHDPNDWEIGQRHNLPVINVFAPDATISDKHGWTDVSPEAQQFLLRSREAARDAVVKWFKDHDLLDSVRDYTHSVGHSDRSGVPIEPWLSDQWYVRVTDDRMRGEALRAMAPEQREDRQDGGTGVSPVPRPTRPSAVVGDELQKKRRTLPHWQLGGSTYFVTFRLKDGELTEDERQIVVDACQHWHGQRATLHLVTVMPDHVHLLLTPWESGRGPDGETTWHSLSELLHSIKSYSAHEIQRRRESSGSLWQDESFDRIVRDDDEFAEKWGYMTNNPVKAGLVDNPGSYRFTVRPDPETGHRRDACATITSKSGDGELRFYPARYARTFQHWHENLRDWCISRQLWWGHRIPVWSGTNQVKGLEQVFQRPSNTDTRPPTTVLIDSIEVAFQTRPGADGMPIYYWCVPPGYPQIERRFEECGYKQDPDVLDTWFSSGLWPISTMGWPDPDAFPETKGLLETFNPSTVLSTAREIITLWVSRMVMFNRYFRDGVLPFRDVFIHAIIQDGHGQKMSKSLGNGVDPRDIIHSHGADAMRFILAQMATNTQDVRLPVDMVCPHCGETVHPKEITTQQGYRVAAPRQECPKCKRNMASGYGAASGLATPTKDMPLARNTSSKFDLGRNFSNKLWNAARFALSNLDTKAAGLPSHGFEELALVDRWMLTRLHHALRAVDDAIRGYQFNAYAEAMYDMVWRDFCDWYLEAIKPSVKSSPAQQQVLRSVLNAILRMLHPVCPFVTEALWPHVQASGAAGLPGIELPGNELLAAAAWPVIDDSIADDHASSTFQRAQALTDQIRNLRGEHKVQPRKKIHLHATEDVRELIERSGAVVPTLAGLEAVTSINADSKRQAAAVVFMFEGREQHLSGFVDAVDAEAERARLAKLVEDKMKSVSSMQGRLHNAGYVAKAPPALVEETRFKLAEAEADLAAARKALESLGV